MSISEKIKMRMKLAIREEIERKHKLGEKYAIEKDGKVVIVDPVTGEETEVKDDEPDADV